MKTNGNSLLGTLLLVGLSVPIVLSALTIFEMTSKTSKTASGISVQKQIEIQAILQQMELDALNASKGFALRGKALSVHPKATWIGDISKISEFRSNYNIRFANIGQKDVWHSVVLLNPDGTQFSIFRIGAVLNQNSIEYILERISNGTIRNRATFKVFGDWDFVNQDQAMPRFIYDEKTKAITALLPSVFGYGYLNMSGKNNQNENYVPRGVILKCGL